MAARKSSKQQRKTHSILANLHEILSHELRIWGPAAVSEHFMWLFFLKMIEDRDRNAEVPYPEHLRWRNWAAPSKGPSATHNLLDFVNNELIPGYRTWTPPSQHAERGKLLRNVFAEVKNRIQSADVLRKVIDELSRLDLGFTREPEVLESIHNELVELLRGETESFSTALLARFLIKSVQPQRGEVILDPDCGAGDFLVGAATEMRKQSPNAPLPNGNFRGFETSLPDYLMTVVRLMLVGVDVPAGIQLVKGESPTEWLVPAEPRPDVIMTQTPKDDTVTRFFKFDRTSDYLTYILDSLPSHGRAAVVTPPDFLGNMLLGAPIKKRLLEECNLYRIDRFGRRRPHQPFGFDADILHFDKHSSTTEVEYAEHNEYDSDHPSRMNFSWKTSAREILRRGYHFDVAPPQFQRTSLSVRSLLIQSYRGFEKLFIQLPERGPTVLIGINGSGKTSILDAVALHLASFSAAMRDEPQRAAETQISANDVHRGADTAAISAVVDVDGRGENWQIAGPSKKKMVRLGDISMVESTRFILEKLHHVPTTGIPLVCYYPATRGLGGGDSRDKQKSFAFPQLQAYKHAFGRGLGPFQDFVDWFRDEEDAENEWRLRIDAAYRSQKLEIVRQAVQGFLEALGSAHFTNLRMERIDSARGGKKIAELVVDKDGARLSIAQLSEGERNTLLLVADLASRLGIANPDANSPTGSGIVLIDEVDSHLHPAWQRELLPALEKTFPGCQFIVTTHSPQVLSRVPKDNVFILENFQLVPKHPHTYGRDANSILGEVMGLPERPKDVEQMIHEASRLVDEERLEEAQAMLAKLAATVGDDDRMIVRIRTLMSFLDEEN